MIKIIKNVSLQEYSWVGQNFPSGYEHTIPESEYSLWAKDSILLIAIANGIAVVNNGTSDIADINEAIDYLKGPQTQPISGEVVPRTIKNEHCMEPWGCEKGYIVNSENVCEITLSNGSENGYTFNYVSTITPRIGDYVFQDNFCKRNWISSLNTENSTLTFSSERGPMANGTGVYSKGKWIDTIVPDWKPIMELWSITVTSKKSDGSEPSINDFVEFSIVDTNDLFKMDSVTQQLFGVNAVDASPYIIAMGFEDNGEYGHWTKYYDETWVVSVNGKLKKSADGAPAELMPLLTARVSVFVTEVGNLTTNFFVDYDPTSKD